MHSVSRAVAVFVLTITAQACGTIHMPEPVPRLGRIPVELREMKAWETDHTLDRSKRRHFRDGDDTALAFGEYSATEIRHTHSNVGGLRALVKGRWESRHSYSFSLRRSDAGVWAVRCDSRAIEQNGLLLGSVQIGGSERTSLDCSFRSPADTSALWVLDVKASRLGAREGTLRRADGADQGCCLVRGDQIQARGHAVALVSRVAPFRGRVMIAEGVAERDAIAGAAAALLLQRSLFPTESV